MAGTESGIVWVRRQSGLIAAVGALVVFTSWAVSSTLGQRYARETSSITAVLNDEQFLGYLSDIRQSQDRLVSISLQVRADLRAVRPISDGVADRFPILLAYYSARTLASQVRELLFQCQRQLIYSRAIGARTDAIADVARSVSVLQQALAQREQAIDAQLRSSTVNLDRLKADVTDYTDHFQRQVFPRLHPLFETVAKVSTATFEEGQKRLQSVKQSADRTSTIAVILYALGSILALGGKFVESSKR
jgi:hypothetical protein